MRDYNIPVPQASPYQSTGRGGRLGGGGRGGNDTLLKYIELLIKAMGAKGAYDQIKDWLTGTATGVAGAKGVAGTAGASGTGGVMELGAGAGLSSTLSLLALPFIVKEVGDRTGTWDAMQEVGKTGGENLSRTLGDMNENLNNATRLDWQGTSNTLNENMQALNENVLNPISDTFRDKLEDLLKGNIGDFMGIKF